MRGSLGELWEFSFSKEYISGSTFFSPFNIDIVSNYLYHRVSFVENDPWW